jgi:hypothetical protein
MWSNISSKYSKPLNLVMIYMKIGSSVEGRLRITGLKFEFIEIYLFLILLRIRQ